MKKLTENELATLNIQPSVVEKLRNMSDGSFLLKEFLQEKRKDKNKGQ